MKTITLFQPWASIVAIGEKKIETRSWSTKYRGKLALHAAVKKNNANIPMSHAKVFREALKKHGLVLKRDFPTGAIIATCKLTACLKIISEDKKENTAQLKTGYLVSGNEYYFGDYTPGRYAWILEDVQPLEEPIPAKGMQKLWNWEG